jgi:hypothetical protein
MSYVSIDHLLDIAAETVARISCATSSQIARKIALRVSGGHGGRRFLWALHNTIEDIRNTGIEDEDLVIILFALLFIFEFNLFLKLFMNT